MTGDKPRIVPFKAEHVLELEMVPLEYATIAELALFYEANGASFTAYAGDAIIGAAGAFSFMPGVLHVWFIPGVAAGDHKLWLIREIHKSLNELSIGTRRIQAYVNPENSKHMKFIKSFGFEYEGLHKALGPSGEDLCTFARINN